MEERAQVQECPPPTWDRRREPAHAPGLRTRARPSPGGKETGCGAGRPRVGKGAGPAPRCPQQHRVHSTGSGGRDQERPVDNGLHLRGDREGPGLGWLPGIWSSLPSCPRSPGHYPGPEVSVPEGRSPRRPRPSPLQGPSVPQRETQPGLRLQSCPQSVHGPQLGNGTAMPHHCMGVGGGEWGAGAGRNVVHPDARDLAELVLLARHWTLAAEPTAQSAFLQQGVPPAGRQANTGGACLCSPRPPLEGLAALPPTAPGTPPMESPGPDEAEPVGGEARIEAWFPSPTAQPAGGSRGSGIGRHLAFLSWDRRAWDLRSGLWSCAQLAVDTAPSILPQLPRARESRALRSRWGGWGGEGGQRKAPGSSSTS